MIPRPADLLGDTQGTPRDEKQCPSLACESSGLRLHNWSPVTPRPQARTLSSAFRESPSSPIGRQSSVGLHWGCSARPGPPAFDSPAVPSMARTRSPPSPRQSGDLEPFRAHAPAQAHPPAPEKAAVTHWRIWYVSLFSQEFSQSEWVLPTARFVVHMVPKHPAGYRCAPSGSHSPSRARHAQPVLTKTTFNPQEAHDP